jgi:hypothetical protein
MAIFSTWDGAWQSRAQVTEPNMIATTILQKKPRTALRLKNSPNRTQLQIKANSDDSLPTQDNLNQFCMPRSFGIGPNLLSCQQVIVAIAHSTKPTNVNATGAQGRGSSA